MDTLKTGEVAYYDAMAGALKCKVLSIKPRLGRESQTGLLVRPSSDILVDFEFLETAGGYKKGEKGQVWSLFVVPHKSYLKLSIHIKSYQVQVDTCNG